MIRRLLVHRAVVGALLLPLVFGVLVLWSLGDRAERTEAVPAAVVNLDQPVTRGRGEDRQVIAAGRLLAAGLTAPSDEADATLGWELTSPEDAERGLEDGGYYAVVTIPRGFSATLAGVTGEHPRRAELSVRGNDASSALVAEASRQVAEVATARLGRRVTRTFLEGVLSRTDELRLELGRAADAAGRVARGATRVASGADRLGTGAGALAGGLGQLAQGAGRLGTGASRLASGTDQVARGAERLAGGADRLDRGTARLSAGLERLERGTDPLPRQSERLADGARRVADGAAAYSRIVAGWKDACLTSPVVAAARPELCAATIRAAGPRGENAEQLRAGARQVADGARRLADAAPRLEGSLDRAAAGSQRLAEGSGRLATGTERLAGGARRLADGARTLAGGAGDLAGGAQQADAGADRLVDGSGRLAAGSRRLGDGSERLADGLAEGVRGVPAADPSSAAVVADPVRATARDLNPVREGSTLLAPVVLAFGLWLGAFATYLVRRALPAALASAAGSAWSHAARGWLPAVGVGLVQAVLLLLGTLALGASYSSWPGVLVVLGASAAAFAALNQAFVALLGTRRGRVALLAFTVLQAVALGGLVPVDTAPGPVRLLHLVLPVPRAADALGALVLGRAAGSPVTDTVVVLAWGALALAATAWAARRRSQVSARALRRALDPAAIA